LNPRIHHIGYVVEDIESYAASFPFAVHEQSVFDPLQGAQLALYSVGDGSRIEFIQPNGPSSFTWGFLKSAGAGMHHICYEGLTLPQVELVCREKKLFKLRGPMPAILFGRDVLFAITRQKAIVEFLL